MSRVVYTPIRPGDSRGEAVVNGIFGDLAAKSASWDQENILPESIDGPNVVPYPVWERLQSQSIATRNAATIAKIGVFTQLVHNGLPLRLTMGAPLTVAADEELRFRAWIYFGATVAAGLGVEGDLSFEWWRDTGPAKIPFSGGRLNRAAQNRPAHDWNQHGEAWLEGHVAGPTTINWAEVRYTYAFAGAANAFPTHSVIWADLRRRWTL